MEKYNCTWTWALIRLIQRGPTLNDILLRMAGIKYLSLIDASLDYHNLKLDDRLSYLTKFSCPFGRYRYLRFSIEAVQAGNMGQEEEK